MAEELKYILEIIEKITKSSAVYLLKLNTSEKEILASTIDNIDLDLDKLFISFNNSGKHILEDDIKTVFSSKTFLKSHSWASVYIKCIPAPSSSNNDYFLILFSSTRGNFSKELLTSATPVMESLTEQVIIFENRLNSEIAGVKIEENSTIDISEYKYDQMIDLIFELSDDLIFILDKDGCIFKINDLGAACLEYNPGELSGFHLNELVSPRHKHVFAKSFRKILDEDNLLSFETALLSKIGNEVNFQINYKVIKDKDNICGVVGIGKNITALRSYEDKINDLNLRLVEANRIISLERQRSDRQKAILSELNKMKSEFVSNISHELRTPLASIIGFSETISSDPELRDEMKHEFNEIILNEGKRLAKLINDVLDISKLEVGQIELNKSNFDILTILLEAIDANRKSMEAKEIQLTTEIPTEPVNIKADKEKIFRVFSSLINNAVKFNYPKGRITISAQSLFKEFEVAISDTGSGIPEKDLPYIFQKFYRVSRPGSEIPGTGLGLVFVKQIVDLHKGFLSINSEINKGTTVLLKLPKEIRV